MFIIIKALMIIGKKKSINKNNSLHKIPSKCQYVNVRN